MGSPKRFLLVASVISIVLEHGAGAQRLTAELCSAKLPRPAMWMSPFYDGLDTIYLFSGWDNIWINQTLKYSISQDRLEFTINLPVANIAGAAVMNRFEQILYFEGWKNKDIFLYSPLPQRFRKISSFANEDVGRLLVKPDMDTALIFGGLHNLTVTSLNLSTFQSETISSHPTCMWGTFAEAIWSKKNDLAYLFTDADTVTYNRAKNQFLSLGKKVPIEYNKNGVTDGKYIYLFGSLKNNTGLLLFDPKDDTMRLLDVENKPQCEGVATVYVERLNRIYLFGGQERWPLSNQIYYINLDPMKEPSTTTTTTTTTEQPPITTMDPDIFNCVGRPDAVFPYPDDCAKFVICRENHGYPYDCPENLLFHPVNRQCTWPDWVDCSGECEDQQM